MNNQTPANVPMIGNGYLIVNVTSARGTIPVENAFVVIRGSGERGSGMEGDRIFASLYTNADGATEKIALPAPIASESQQPGIPYPYSLYSVEVSKEGFYRIADLNLPIFGGITSILPVNLIPAAEFSDSNHPYPDFGRTVSDTPPVNPML